MSFIEGFYSFHIQLSDTSAGRYEKFRVKLARHPLESMQFMYARLLVYIMNYQEGLEFTRSIAEPKQPAVIKKDLLGEPVCWYEAGAPGKDKLSRALRSFPEADFAVYFYTQDNLNEFCHSLRGSRSNWVEKVRFYQIDPQFTAKLAEIKKSSSVWNVTIVDSSIYLVFDDIEFETAIPAVDIWREFQSSIDNTGSPA